MSSREPTPTDLSEEESSDLEPTGTIWRPPLTCDLSNGESETVDSKVPASKLRRYDATSQLSVYSEQDTTSVAKQTLTDGRDLAQGFANTSSASDSHAPVSKGCDGKTGKSSTADLKLDNNSQCDGSRSNQVLWHGKVSSDIEKKRSPSKGRLWLEDTPEMFYVVDSKAVPSYLSASTNTGLARLKRYDGTSQLGALLKKENVAISVDNLGPRLKRYDATSELSLYKNKNASVLKQTSSNAQFPADISPETISSTGIVRKMKRYDATSELSLYRNQETASALTPTSPKEVCPIQSFPEAGSSTHIASKMIRYNATSELSLYKKQETSSVLEQTSLYAHIPDQCLHKTDSVSERNDPVVKDCTTNDGQSSSCVASSKFGNGHELDVPEDKKAGPSDQMISQGSVSNEQGKAHTPTNARYWFEENPESFDALERVQSANGSEGSDATEEIANFESKGRPKVSERKKTGLFSCWRAPLLKKHKKKQVYPEGLNDQPSTVAISTTGTTLVTSEPVDTVEPNPVLFTTLRECSTFFRVPYNPISPAKPHEIEAARIRMEAFLANKALTDVNNGLATANDATAPAGKKFQNEIVKSEVHKAETLSKSSSSSNNDRQVSTNPQDQQKPQPLIPKFVWRPNEQISPASKKDLANAEKRLQMYFASKNLPMPGASGSVKPMVNAPSSSAKSEAPVGSAEALKAVFAVKLPK